MEIKKTYEMIDGLFSLVDEIDDDVIRGTAKNWIYKLRDSISELHDKVLQSANDLSISKKEVVELKTKNRMLQAALDGMIEGLERECD